MEEDQCLQTEKGNWLFRTSYFLETLATLFSRGLCIVILFIVIQLPPLSYENCW